MQESKLPLSFYQSNDTLALAEKLLGCELVHESPEGITSGIIVETEAYLRDDPACHAFNRRTPRTEPMYGEPGTIYVYLIYGMYQCFNIVSNVVGVGEAVLIRALQPTAGLDLMQLRRQVVPKTPVLPAKPQKEFAVKELCRGPGKLVKAMGIDRTLHNNLTLTDGPIYLTAPAVADFEVTVTTRIGINVGATLPYRFFIKNNPFVSKG
ncbi:DNA-3-methyladenine glycosylase [Dyadobacter sp. CY343]|uniref:DNA-3-methyladenine glycosylase n=1 Tax=Dyadobacter sp. CY343 TaxID=2907299 RepID=UPI001F368378|nr:DNA-3-methyladenine glycosylase [Dyadobacter sp. CY343]MCE7060123.1 DNA-3-methyladenine glycosylase [Dyadobacter sp. CY343]